MNKLIVGALVFLILIIFLTLLLTSFGNRAQTSKAVITPVPTTFYGRGGSSAVGGTDTETFREPSKEALAQANKIIPQDQLSKVDAFTKELPVVTNDFEFAYSGGTGEYYYRFKTQDGAQKLEEYLQQKGALDFKNNFGHLFNKTDRPVSAEVQKAEEELIKARVNQFKLEQQSSAGKKSSTKEEKQFVDVTKTLLDFKLKVDTPSAPSGKGGGTGGIGAIVNPNALDQIFNEAGSKVGTPPKMLKAIMSIECGRLLSTSDGEILAWSAPGAGLPPGHGCRQNQGGYGAYGPMQFVPGTFARYGSAVNRIGGYTHAPNIQNIKDSVYAAAELFLLNSNGGSGSNWTLEQMKRAYVCYAAGCRQYDTGRLGADTQRLFATFLDRYNSY